MLLFSSKPNLPTLHTSSPPFTTWLIPSRTTNNNAQNNTHILYLGLVPKTIIRLPIPINLRLPRSPITERRGLAIHHEPIHSAELLKSIFLGYLSHVALVSLASSSLMTLFITHWHRHIFIIPLLIANTIYSITLCFALIPHSLME